jgi:hypothetical protein
MSIVWLVPVAIWGLVALAVPILVHLLTRQERRPVAFPSLRFLKTTRLAAMRQRRIHDWLLLIVRAAAIAAALAALAGPLLVTAARERAWNARIARAIVVVDGAAAPADEMNLAFSSRVFASGPRVAEGIRAAVEWLAAEPPAARELLIAGDLREEAIQEADLSIVPGHVGIRFLPETKSSPQPDVELPVMTLAGSNVIVEERQVRLNPNDTVVEIGSRAAASTMPMHRLEMRATPNDQPAADAALAALLAEGIVADVPGARNVIVVWPGANEPEATDGVVIVHAPEKPLGAASVGVLRAIAADVLDDPEMPREPRRIAAVDLARWSRPTGRAPSDAVKQDEGDRRMLWALALALLMLEWVLRRSDRNSVRAGEPAIEETLAAPKPSLGEGGRVA